ncbi:hypothetical protein H8356DRAFT_1352271 [Neocallimastix lanati (nom. inval.)]|nr:hypothetical protein H8356DRAFT_1352271 [Neocallimastix sp. JGI-2020a]
MNSYLNSVVVITFALHAKGLRFESGIGVMHNANCSPRLYDHYQVIIKEFLRNMDLMFLLLISTSKILNNNMYGQFYLYKKKVCDYHNIPTAPEVGAEIKSVGRFSKEL